MARPKGKASLHPADRLDALCHQACRADGRCRPRKPDREPVPTRPRRLDREDDEAGNDRPEGDGHPCGRAADTDHDGRARGPEDRIERSPARKTGGCGEQRRGREKWRSDGERAEVKDGEERRGDRDGEPGADEAGKPPRLEPPLGAVGHRRTDEMVERQDRAAWQIRRHRSCLGRFDHTLELVLAYPLRRCHGIRQRLTHGGMMAASL